MKRKYHGDTANPEALSMTYKCMLGMEMFSPMYDLEETKTTKTRSERSERVLKPCLYPMSIDRGKRIVGSPDSHKKGINMRNLSAKTVKDLSCVQPRNLWDWAKEVESNGRKMQQIIANSPYKDGQLPSGESWEDYLKYCRFMMMRRQIAEAKRKKRPAPTEDEEDDEDEEEDDADATSREDATTTETSVAASKANNEQVGEEGEGGNDEEEEEETADELAEKIKNWSGEWTFNGFMAWALWGHILPPDMDEDYRAKSFLVSDESSNRKKNGRTAARSEKKDESDLARASVEFLEEDV